MDKSKFLSLTMGLGRVVAKEYTHRAKVVVQLNRFNPYLNMFFPETETLESHDPNDNSKVGDIVLLRKLDQPLRHIETHKIESIVFCSGSIVDPLTGLRVERDKYIDIEPLTEDDVVKLQNEIKENEVLERVAHMPRKSEYHWENNDIYRKQK
uniref:Mitochondrial ribosomal protein S17 n=1 Tax=Ciona savignyi TaxID=51511 RepID=H2ZEC3_CIOSA